MYVEKLKLFQYKNFKDFECHFSQSINCIVGNNGKGKTNILDAIHYLTLAKSYLQHSDLLNIQFHENFFLIEGSMCQEALVNQIKITVHREHKKIIKKNNKTFDKISDYIGQYYSVIISPYDTNLISEGSEHRRKFIDSILSQLDSVYLHELIKYNKILAQRNALLKFFYANQTFDAETLSLYDTQLTQSGNTLFEKRKAFLAILEPKFQFYYQKITENSEEVSLQYQSQLEEDSFERLLSNSLAKDKATQYTQVGVHKDDYKFYIHQVPIKKFGSQGQQKSYLIALKLAQMAIVKEQKQSIPILLLDDIFDKLDEKRVSLLISLVKESHFGQIFITDTHEDRTRKIVADIDQNAHFITL